MAKIVLSKEGVVQQEVALVRERITLGRGPHNDIVIDDGAISAEHAVIVTVDDDSFLEDLNSTNGTQVNGQPVKKHFLRNGDVVELAGYHALYIAIVEEKDDRTYEAATETSSRSTEGAREGALIRILNGPSAGKEIELTKTLTTLGHPSMQVAVIARRIEGYYLTRIEGADDMSVNGEPLGKESRCMANNDLIDLSGTQMRFLRQETSQYKLNSASTAMADLMRHYDNN